MPIEPREKQLFLSRRDLLWAVGGATGASLAVTQTGAGSALAADRTNHQGGKTDKEASAHRGMLKGLVAALEVVGSPVCRDAAAQLNRLVTYNRAPLSFDLHLRGAGLDAMDAIRLAAAIRPFGDPQGPALRSFSASYNDRLTDAGAVALAEAFPSSMSELGFVGCGLGDDSAAAIFAWAERAPALTMICVEDNRFSVEAKGRFKRLGRRRGGMWVVV